jgi:hypothetical protein
MLAPRDAVVLSFPDKRSLALQTLKTLFVQRIRSIAFNISRIAPGASFLCILYNLNHSTG